MTVQMISEILAYVEELAPGHVCAEPLDEKTDLIGAGILDSLNLVRLIGFVETRYGLTIADEDIGPDLFENVQSLVSYISANRPV